MTLTNEAEQTLDTPTVPRYSKTQAPVVNVVVVGLSEEEEEGINIASEKIKVTFTKKVPTGIAPIGLLP